MEHSFHINVYVSFIEKSASRIVLVIVEGGLFLGISMLYRWRHIRRSIFDSFSKIPFGIYVFLYLFLFFSFIVARVGGYDGNLSALIGIYEGFANANSPYRQENFIIYKDGGYDGQFFFFISEYLFHGKINTLPILDAFRLRFSRIGMPILSGFLGVFLGFEFYPIYTLFLLIVFHILSAYLLKKLLPFQKKGLYLLYLFSPFTINADLLLVCDGLFASCFLILIYALKRAGLSITKVHSFKRPYAFHKEFIFPLFFGALFFLLIRETALPFLLTILLYSILQRQNSISITLFFSVICYLSFYLFVATYAGFPEGTNPLSFLELSDFPAFGFLKSISIPDDLQLGTLSREFIKFPLFFLLISLGLQTLEVPSWKERILFLPIYFMVTLGFIAEKGYWLSFDNSSRFFTLAVPYMLLVSGRLSAHRWYGMLELNGFLFLAVGIRFLAIKQPMNFTLW